MQVFKFGGASVKDAPAVKNVATIINKFANCNTVIVVSAMGKTTNKLEEITNAYFYKNTDVLSLIEDLKAFHFEIIENLGFENTDSVFNEIENCFTEIIWATEEENSGNYGYHYDQIVSMGEMLATHIVSAYLNKNGVSNLWLDVRGIIQTDNTYRDAKVDYDVSDTLVKTHLIPAVEKHKLVLLQGFVGGTSENYTTTLGREGSDYTAALIAYFTDAQSVTIWKDVAGVLNADPKYFKNTKKIDELTYHDAIELTYYGATVIHPKTIKPLQNKNITLYVKSFIQPNNAGTVIKESNLRVNIPSYIFKENQILISLQPKDFSFIAEDNLSDIFKIFSKFQIHANMMQNSALSFSVCVNYDELKIKPLIDELQHHFKVLYNHPVQLMTVRNYNNEILSKLSDNKLILLEQRTRHTHQMVMKEAGGI
ncbi:MAG: aspartate kinase [Bacteroidetes bacterium]|nr:aspartate kinase [Bacteroidota bacterium]